MQVPLSTELFEEAPEPCACRYCDSIGVSVDVCKLLLLRSRFQTAADYVYRASSLVERATGDGSEGASPSLISLSQAALSLAASIAACDAALDAITGTTGDH